MAYLSQVTDQKVMQQAHMSPTRRRAQELLQPEQAGIVNQGQFESKIRCLEMYDGRQPLEKLRVWTAEQDGSLTVRKATTGDATTTLEKKKGVFVTALKYHEGFMYSGMSDGYIRVYREVPDGQIMMKCEAGKPLSLTFEGSSNIIAKVKLGTPPDLAGFAEGMMITHVNRQPTNTAEEVRAACDGDCTFTVKTVNKAGEADYELCSEVRKHTGAITCLEVVSDNKGDVIFSGGRDWQVFVWEWNAERTVFRAKDIFTGHQNAVRCLYYHPADYLGRYGGFLYSGGDDHTVRCLDINKKKERTDGFPLGMRGSVRALAAFKRHLFTATADGLVQVWDSTLGTHIATLLRGMTHPASQPQAQLCLIVANNCVWSGGVDGTIRVWKAAGPAGDSHDWQMCELTEHKGAFVNNMSAVQGAADGHVAWHLSNEGKIQLLYTESDSASSVTEWSHNEGFTMKEQELIEMIEKMRKEMLKISIELQQQELLCEKLEKIDKDRKFRIIAALGEASGITLKTRYYQKLIKWLMQDQAASRRRTLSQAMFTNSTTGFLKIYYSKWSRLTDILKDQARKKKFAETLLCATQRGMQIIYYRKLVEYTNKIDGDRKRRELGQILGSNVKKGIMATYHTKCIRWTFNQLQNKKREQISNMLLSTTKTGMMSVYYNKLIDYYRREKDAAKRMILSHSMQATSDNGLRALYLSKCMRWLKKQKDDAKQKAVSDILLSQTEDGLRRIYRKKCIDWLVKKKNDELQDKISDLDQKIDELEKMLEQSRSFTDEMIDTEMASLQREIADSERDILRLEKELEELSTEVLRLKSDLMSTFSVDTSKPEDEQLRDLLVHLKSHGCNCKYDFDAIASCKEFNKKHTEFKKTKDATKRDAKFPHSPQRLFEQGLSKVREALGESSARLHGQDSPRPEVGKKWLLPSDIVTRMDDKLYHKHCHLGLKQMIIAWDQLVLEDTKKTGELTGQKEAVLNANWLIAIVTRLWGERKRSQLSEAKGTAQADEDELQELEKLDKEAKKQARKAAADGRVTPRTTGKRTPSSKPAGSPATRPVTAPAGTPAGTPATRPGTAPAATASSAAASTPADTPEEEPVQATPTTTPARRGSTVPDSAKKPSGKTAVPGTKPKTKPAQRRTGTTRK